MTNIEVLFNPEKYLALPFRDQKPIIAKGLRTCHMCGVRIEKGEQFYKLNTSDIRYMNFCMHCVLLNEVTTNRIEKEKSREKIIKEKLFHINCIRNFCQEERTKKMYRVASFYTNGKEEEFGWLGETIFAMERSLKEDKKKAIITDLSGRIIKEMNFGQANAKPCDPINNR